MPSADEDLTVDEAERGGRRVGRIRRALVIGVGVAALLSACTDDGDASNAGSQPAQPGGGGTGGSDAGSGDSGGDSGGGDSGGSTGGDSGGGDSGGSTGGDSGGGDTGATQPPPSSGTDDGFTTEEWVLLILLGIAAIAIIIGATAAASSHSAKRDARRREEVRRLREITSGCRWVNDQATMSVLQATSADQLTYAWTTTRSHMLDLESKIAATSAGTSDGNLSQSLSYLGQALAGLRGALESNVQLRQRPDAAEQTDLLAASAQTVSNRRQQVESAMAPVMAAQQ